MTDSIWPIAPEVSGWIIFAFRVTIGLGIFFFNWANSLGKKMITLIISVRYKIMGHPICPAYF